MNKSTTDQTRMSLDDFIKKEKGKGPQIIKNNSNGNGLGKAKRIFKGRKVSDRNRRYVKYDYQQERPQYNEREVRREYREPREIQRREPRTVMAPLRKRNPLDLRKMMRGGARDKRDKRDKKEERPPLIKSKKAALSVLHVNNLPVKLTNSELNDLFCELGYLKKCKLVLDDFGKSKGKGVVQYENPADSKRAIEELDGKKLDGRVISVGFSNYVREKDQQHRKYKKKTESRMTKRKVSSEESEKSESEENRSYSRDE